MSLKQTLVATSTNHYLKDNVVCVARMQTRYIASNITIAHLASQIVQQTHTFVHKVSTNFDIHQMFLVLVFDDFEICKNQGEYLPELLMFNASYYTLFLFMSLLH